jgi:SAM-dependent methyltransferase
MTITPDTKDWTWVLDERCPDCGFEAGSVPRERIGEEIRSSAELWAPLLVDPDATRRPDPTTWSTAEYACHVRDVHRVFGERVRLMLTQDAPTFANWDQDASAEEGAYAQQDPVVVGAELVRAAGACAAAYDAVPDAATWARRGLRSNGSEFSVESLGRYQLHDLVHHAWDVRAAVARATVRAYDVRAQEYAAASTQLDDVVRARLDSFAEQLGEGGRVLEIGSGGGRDAAYLEEAGLVLRRTDVSPGFVTVLREQGRRADQVDPLVDDLADPDGPYDGVWANASLLHVARADLLVVVRRLAVVTRPGGTLMLSVKAGDGEGWSTHGTISGARRFVYWREPDLRRAVVRAGWTVQDVVDGPGVRGEQWLMLTATRAEP